MGEPAEGSPGSEGGAATGRRSRGRRLLLSVLAGCAASVLTFPADFLLSLRREVGRIGHAAPRSGQYGRIAAIRAWFVGRGAAVAAGRRGRSPSSDFPGCRRRRLTATVGADSGLTDLIQRK